MGTEPAPEDEPVSGRDGGDRIELQEAEPSHGFENPAGGAVELLRADRDPARPLRSDRSRLGGHRRHHLGVSERTVRKAEAFAALHTGDPFMIPNPWDARSARVLAALGFEALATTSSGFAFTLGRRDGRVTLDEVVEHAAAIDRATELPVSVDLENGYGADPAGAARAIGRVAEAGPVRGSIAGYEPPRQLYELEHAAERIAAAAEAARRLPFPLVLTARAEKHLRGNPDLADTIARPRGYER